MAKPFKSEYDLMAEAYGNISYNKQQLINEDKAGRRVRGYTQQQGQLITEAEGTTLEIGGQTYTVGEQDPNDDGTIIEIEKHRNGYFITGGEYTDMQGEGSYADDRDNPKVGYGYALTLDGKPMDEDDLEDRDMDHDLSTVDRGTGRFEDAEEQPGDDFFEALDDVLMITGTENAHAVVGGMEVKLGRKLSPLETEHAHNVIQDDELPEDAEGAAKFELVGSGGRGSQVTGAGKSFNSLEEVCAAAGINPSECAKAELWDDMGNGTKEFQVDEDNVIVMHGAASEDAEGSNIDQVEALTASISDGIIQLARLMDSEEMVDDDDLSIGAAATNALENLKAMLNNIV